MDNPAPTPSSENPSSSPSVAQQAPPPVPKNSVNYLLIVFIVFLLAVVAVLSMALLSKTNSSPKNITQESISPSPVLVSTTPPAQPTQSSNSQAIKVLNISSQCSIAGSPIQIEAKKAYLVPNSVGFPAYKLEEISRDYPDYFPGNFLVIQSTARNSSVSKTSYTTVYAADYFRLVRGSSDSKPIIFGGPTLAPQDTGTVFAFFPIKTSENTFNLTFCDFADPIKLNIDFGSSGVQVVRGQFSVDKGFTQSFD